MQCYPKIRSECQKQCVVKFPSDQAISLRIINEKQGHSASDHAY